MRRTGILGLVVASCLALAAAAHAATPAGEYTFTVMKDGDPIGTHRVTFVRRGERIEIEAATDIEVTFATIPVYTFEHERREVWEKGRALLVHAKTIEDGDLYDITVQPDGGGYVRTVNGRVDHFDPSTQILAYWNQDTLRYDSFFSVIEDKVLRASFHYVGRDTVLVDGKSIDATHYRMVGDENRDLWFDSDGVIAKVQFDRRGSEIVYLRNQLEPMPADGTCAVSC